MRHLVSGRGLCRAVLATAMMASAAIGGLAVGQETAADAPAVAKKFRGRLPNYYRHFVDKEQRAVIYAIQEEYASKIAELKAQLVAITKERDTKVVGVLTPEQAKEIERMQAEAEAKREKKQPAETPPPEKE